MTKQLSRALMLASLVLLASAVVALAAPVKGKTYKGALVRGHERITLRVSKSGHSVLVNVPFAPLYCASGGALQRQSSVAVPISRSGTFAGLIAYEFTQTHLKIAHLTFSGKFSGRTVTGVAHSEFLLAVLKNCDGSSTFSAKATKK